MNILIRLPIIAAALVLPALAPAGEWTHVAADSTLGFDAEQQGAPFEGLFRRFTTNFELEPADPSQARFEAIIDMDSVDTLYDERDEALRDAEWFDVETWPEARFVTQSVQRAAEGYIADALLTIKGETNPVALAFTIENLPDGRLAFVGETKLSRLAFNVGTGQWTNTDWVGDAVRIRVNLVLEPTLP